MDKTGDAINLKTIEIISEIKNNILEKGEKIMMKNGFPLMNKINKYPLYEIGSYFYELIEEENEESKAIKIILEYMNSRKFEDQTDFISSLPNLKESRDRLELRMDIKQRKETVGQGVFTCKFCKSKATTHKYVQIRSADEGESARVLCSNCGKTFTVG